MLLYLVKLESSRTLSCKVYKQIGVAFYRRERDVLKENMFVRGY